jgi:hypothetical protein
MSRFRFSLDSELHGRARKRAADLGISLGQCVRNLVIRDRGTEERRVAASAIFDLGRSSGGDIARDKPYDRRSDCLDAHPSGPARFPLTVFVDTSDWSAAAFDGDFAIFRFGPGRKRAFEVLR